MTLNLAIQTQKLIRSKQIKALYYEGWLCSCVAENNGSADPTDTCFDGFRYKDPVEYGVMRTQVDMRRIHDKNAQILQGACQISIPRQQLGHNAVHVSTVDLSANVDLSTVKNIKVTIDGGASTTIDCSASAVDAATTTIDEILHDINDAGLGEIVYESGANGDPNGSGYISITSLFIGNGSSIVFEKPAADDATFEIFGLNETLYPYQFTPDEINYQYVRLYDKISRADVIVIDERTRRDGVLLKRDVNDKIDAFDIQRIISVYQRGVQYKENIDFTFSGSSITWLAGKGPDTETFYSVEVLAKENYIVFEDLALDRGNDGDEIPKKIHMALRQYNETGQERNLPIDN